MALDGIFLSLVREELSPLIGGRIEKVYQPSREELLLGVRTRDGAYRLLINSAAGSARIHVTRAEIENPKTPPMFCMLMRKRLTAGRISAIRQDGYERILYIDVEASNELGDPVKLTVAAEIMGRRSNIILIDGEGRVVDSIKRVTPEMSAVRPVLPGIAYTLPPKSDKLRLDEVTAEELIPRLKELPNKKLSKALVQTLEGISPVFADELVWLTDGGEDKAVNAYSDAELDRLAEAVTAEGEKLRNRQLNYIMLATTEGQLKDFCFTDIRHFGSLMEVRASDSACGLLDDFYSSRDRLERIKQKAQDLFRLLTSLSERTARRIANQRQELKECADRERLKNCGDLIMTNLYALQKGQTSFRCINYMSEAQEETEIALDPRLTPTQNAQRYYKEYKKADTAERLLAGLIEKGEQELAYIDSVLDSLTRADSESDIEQLRDELADEGYIRRRYANGRPPRSLPPLKFISDDGYTILVGRHNRQNDKLTLKDSKKTDIWLHTQNITGSHTVIVTNGETPPDSTILQAARIAALHSKAAMSSQVPVDYTLIKYVKKPNGAKPGMVIFTDQRTVYVKPDPAEAERIKAQ